MELLKLNPNQVKHRAGKAALRDEIEDLCAESLKDLLEHMGLWKRLEESGLVTGEVLDADLTPDERWSRLLDAQYRAGMRGDAQAARAYRELSREQSNQDAFNIHLDIQDYRIADASLKDIVLEADEVPVRDIMDGFAERSELDGCPRDLVARIRNVHADWQEWAKTGLKARGRDGEEDDEQAPVVMSELDALLDELDEDDDG